MKILALVVSAFIFIDLGGFGMSSKTIDEMIALRCSEIKNEQDANIRAQKMNDFVNMLLEVSKSGALVVDGESIEDISTLLEFDGDVGRFYGAKALAILGCQAAPALPSLKDALKKTEAVRSDFYPLILAPAVSPRDEIESAIAEIEQDKSCI